MKPVQSQTLGSASTKHTLYNTPIYAIVLLIETATELGLHQPMGDLCRNKQVGTINNKSVTIAEQPVFISVFTHLEVFCPIHEAPL